MLYDEVIPTLPLDKKDLEDFARAVQDRFNNPFVNHELMSISLNSTSKWRARNMPTFLDYVEEKGSLPKYLCSVYRQLVVLPTLFFEKQSILTSRNPLEHSNKLLTMLSTETKS